METKSKLYSELVAEIKNPGVRQLFAASILGMIIKDLTVDECDELIELLSARWDIDQSHRVMSTILEEYRCRIHGIA